MSRGQRLTMLGIAAVIAAVAVVIALASGGDDDQDDTSPSTAAQTTGQTTPDASTTSTPAPPPKPPEPEIERIQVKNGEPVGGVKDIEVESGDLVRIAVTSDVEEELHLHGYDISRDISAGGTGRFNFKAKLEGVFELELEHSGVQIAELTVKP